MKLKIKLSALFDHLVLILGAGFMLVPVVLVALSTTLTDVDILQNGLQFRIGDQFYNNLVGAMYSASGFSGLNTGWSMLSNSLILGFGFAVGKIIISMMAAYAIVYFRFRFGTFAFWLIFTTLLLPLEVRILPSYEIVQSLGMLNSYAGLIVPLIASATATFFFRQFYKSVPDEMVEAARIDGAGALQFFIDILIPLSRTMIAALFIIMFVYGWNQYLWPTMITTDEDMYTLVRGIKQITQTNDSSRIPELGRSNMLAMIAILPPVLIVVFFQSWFIKGLTETDK